MSNETQPTEEERLNRMKMIIKLKDNKTFLSILADFRLYKIHSMTILDNQIEDESELASYWLNVELDKQLKNKTYGGNK
jgi:phosphatidate phosphatase PAH1